MAEDFYNIEVAIGVLWSCFIAPIGKIILNGELEIWGKPQGISVSGYTNKHRDTISFPGTRSLKDRIIAGSLLRNSKEKERRHVLLLFIKFYIIWQRSFKCRNLIQSKELEGKSINFQLVSIFKNEVACSVNLLCWQSVTVSEENQIWLQSCNHPETLNRCLSSVRTF